MNPETWKKVLQMIAFIKAYQTETGCSPSYQEMGDHIGVAPTYITRLMRIAEARRLVRKPYGKRRDIEVLQ